MRRYCHECARHCLWLTSSKRLRSGCLAGHPLRALGLTSHSLKPVCVAHLRKALQQAGGGLAAARTAGTARLVPQVASGGGVSRPDMQRQWWPESGFCQPAPTAPSITQRAPALVPHQVLVARPPPPQQPQQLSPSMQQQPTASRQPASTAAARRPPGSAASSVQVALPAEAALPLHPHYAAIFLTDKSRQQLLQHVAPLHEDVSADHMTLAYKPSVQQCLQLPLGREAALFVVGAASDWRAQAVAVEHPSWLPYLSESTPHVTISGKPTLSLWLSPLLLSTPTALLLPALPPPACSGNKLLSCRSAGPCFLLQWVRGCLPRRLET